MIKKITLSTILTIFTVLLSFAGNGKVNINKQLPSWLQKVDVINKKPPYKNIQDGYYIFLFERQNNLETKEHYTHIIREISNSSGVQNGSEISVSYDPSYEKLIFHKLVVWRAGKPINKLVSENFKILQNEEELSRFIYSGLFTAYLILDDIRKGDRIEYAYTTQGSNPVFPKYASTIYFEGNSQIVNVYNNIIFDPNRKMRTKTFNDTPVLNKSVVNGLNVFEWQNTMSKTYPDQDFVPSSYNPFARVQISEYQSWEEVVDWGLSIQNFDIKNTTLLNNKIADLKSKSKGNKEKYLELATRFVQDEIRYMGIEMGEYSNRPNTPDKVLNQRYGDCKDKSNLLCYLLKANGIDAYSVFIDTYLNNETAKLLPSPNVFNHETLVVELNDRKVYIDPTISNQRGPIFDNYYPYTAKVLVIKKGVKDLISTPRPNLGRLHSFTVFKVADTSTKSKTSFIITTTYSNNYANTFRDDLNTKGEESLEKSYIEYYTNFYPGLSMKGPLTIKDDELENVITVKEEYEINNFWTKDENLKSKKIAYFYGDLINNQINDLKKFRNAPMSMQFPSTVEQQIKIILPRTWNLQNENLTIDDENYRFVYSANAKKDTLTLNYYYQSFVSALPPIALDKYIKDSKQISALLSYGIYWDGDVAGDLGGLAAMPFSIAIITLILFSFIAMYVYTRHTAYNLEAIKNARKIQGWLIVPAIGITVSPVTILFATFKLEIFNQAIWSAMQTSEHSVFFVWSVVLTVIVNTILFVSSIFILISFYNRRDFFPKYYIGFLCFNFVVLSADYFANAYLTKIVATEAANGTNDLGFLVVKGIFAIIWIVYFIKSDRVKETFVFSYPGSAWRMAMVKDLNEQFEKNDGANDEQAFNDKEIVKIDERL
ncbi:DUF3857 domain-containing protein [Pedobacter endophyticus]|uniref:DUF3857 domain-containing protein n=1 Tax=Pedobacter endophyticus TaxID=2789740 RepID=A0A7S9PZD9_9SPHI|nr:DUF3857 domain-containing protein [Pedobacter endophyticus]QPH39845.1 DUF3857 domain-containing protein [Pedobacter endophyticus]